MSKRYPIAESAIGKLECEISKEGCYFVHFHLKKWSKDNYKEALLIFYKWLHTIHEAGVLAVFVLIPEGDKKLYKWEQMFGFKEIARNGGHILMAQPTGE